MKTYKFAVIIAEEQLKAGRHVLIEYLMSSKIWSKRCLKKLLAKYRVTMTSSTSVSWDPDSCTWCFGSGPELLLQCQHVPKHETKPDNIIVKLVGSAEDIFTTTILMANKPKIRWAAKVTRFES